MGVTVDLMPDLHFRVVVELIRPREIDRVINQYLAHYFLIKQSRKRFEFVQRADAIGESIVVLFRFLKQSVVSLCLLPLPGGGEAPFFSVSHQINSRITGFERHSMLGSRTRAILNDAP
jgi:hypothetical protein